jgi:diacylglycerol kinase (ATP)
MGRRCCIDQGTAPAANDYPAMRALLVHNPTAGGKGHDKDSIMEALELADIKADYVSRKNDDFKRALKDASDLVVAAGGDGTIADVFIHLADRSVPIAILPLGSANNIARSLGIAGTPAELAEQWLSGRTHPFHLIEVTGEDGRKALCAEGFGVGLMPGLIKRRAKEQKADGADDIRRGRRALSELVATAKPIELEVAIDGNPWRSDLASVDVLNIPFTGPALPLAHDADPSDTVIDAIGWESTKRDDLIEWIKSPLEDQPPIASRSGKHIEVRWRAADSRLDDELVEGRSGWRQVLLRCDPEPVRVLVPIQHPAIKKSAKSLVKTNCT